MTFPNILSEVTRSPEAVVLLLLFSGSGFWFWSLLRQFYQRLFAFAYPVLKPLSILARFLPQTVAPRPFSHPPPGECEVIKRAPSICFPIRLQSLSFKAASKWMSPHNPHSSHLAVGSNPYAASGFAYQTFAGKPAWCQRNMSMKLHRRREKSLGAMISRKTNCIFLVLQCTFCEFLCCFPAILRGNLICR